jgi:pyrroline-5-carboxylate reductase
MNGGLKMKIAVIGCGVMGSAFARHFAKAHSVLLSDHNPLKSQWLANEIGASFQENLSDAVQGADVILLAIKPKDLPSVAKTTADFFTKDKILMSILAGTPLALLRKNFISASIVRTMPNLALLYGQGVMGIVEDGHLSLQVRQTVEFLLEGIGLIAWMSEEKIDALTALSGSGIGFILVMIEAMIDGGVHLGFTAEESREFVLKTMEGTVALMRGSGKPPAELKSQIASPGGTTIAGLKVLEEEGVHSGIVHALVACYEKALSMAKDPRL